MAGDLKLIERPRRRAYPRRHADELDAECERLEPYTQGTAHNRQMAMYAMGARDALAWALGGQQRPTNSLSCVEMALGWKQRKGRSRLKSVPAFVRKRKCRENLSS